MALLRYLLKGMSLYQEDNHQQLTTNPMIYTPSSDGSSPGVLLDQMDIAPTFIATPSLYSCVMYLQPHFCYYMLCHVSHAIKTFLPSQVSILTKMKSENVWCVNKEDLYYPKNKTCLLCAVSMSWISSIKHHVCHRHFPCQWVHCSNSTIFHNWGSSVQVWWTQCHPSPMLSRTEDLEIWVGTWGCCKFFG